MMSQPALSPRADERGSLLRLGEAQARLGARVCPRGGLERVASAAAVGRVLGEDVVAARAAPAFDNAAVDGWAFRRSDLAATEALTVSGRTAAGDAAATLGAREAVRVFTGAPMPAGADTVAMEEDCEFDGRMLRPPAGIAEGANRRRAGEDIRAGERVLAAGTRLTPRDAGLLAACGRGEAGVFARPRVAIFSTGDELIEPGGEVSGFGVYDVNRSLIAGFLGGLPCEAVDLGIVKDDPRAVAGILREAASYDAVVASGGMSRGEEDHLQRQIQDLGEMVFWRLAIKPGRPVGFGLVEGVPVAALPGNPVAVWVTFLFVARPMLLMLCGASEVYVRPVYLPVGFGGRKKPGRREFWRVRIAGGGGDDGGSFLERFERQGAGVVSSLTGSDGVVEFDEDIEEICEGECYPFYGWGLGVL